MSRLEFDISEWGGDIPDADGSAKQDGFVESQSSPEASSAHRDEFEEERLGMQCDKGHSLQQKQTAILYGHISGHCCRLCLRQIARAEICYSCVLGCSFDVCKDCFQADANSDVVDGQELVRVRHGKALYDLSCVRKPVKRRKALRIDSGSEKDSALLEENDQHQSRNAVWIDTGAADHPKLLKTSSQLDQILTLQCDLGHGLARKKPSLFSGRMRARMCARCSRLLERSESCYTCSKGCSFNVCKACFESTSQEARPIFSSGSDFSGLSPIGTFSRNIAPTNTLDVSSQGDAEADEEVGGDLMSGSSAGDLVSCSSSNTGRRWGIATNRANAAVLSPARDLAKKMQHIRKPFVKRGELPNRQRR